MADGPVRWVGHPPTHGRLPVAPVRARPDPTSSAQERALIARGHLAFRVDVVAGGSAVGGTQSGDGYRRIIRLRLHLSRLLRDAR